MMPKHFTSSANFMVRSRSVACAGTIRNLAFRGRSHLMRFRPKMPNGRTSIRPFMEPSSFEASDAGVADRCELVHRLLVCGKVAGCRLQRCGASARQLARPIPACAASVCKGLVKWRKSSDDCPFGSAAFLDLIATSEFDVLCHHAARVGDYRSLDFDIPAAVAENTNNFRTILERMQATGLKAVIFTGSLLRGGRRRRQRADERVFPLWLVQGANCPGGPPLVRPLQRAVGKFVIANPFGPLEEPRFPRLFD